MTDFILLCFSGLFETIMQLKNKNANKSMYRLNGLDLTTPRQNVSNGFAVNFSFVFLFF